MDQSSVSSLTLTQQQGQTGTSTTFPAKDGGGSSSSSGSIGPFFAVISVLTVLAIISCVLGRMCTRRTVTVLTPLDSIKYRGCWGWVRRKCRQCVAGDVEVGARVMAFGDERINNDDKPKNPAPQASS